MYKSKELKNYISSSFPSSEIFMSSVHGGIRYIYEAEEAGTSLTDRSGHAAVLIGICARGTFYTLSEEYRDVGKNYTHELLAFEDLYNNIFDKQMKAYSAQNPIGGKASEAVMIRLNEFEKRDMHAVALDLIFGNLNASEKPVDHSYFEPLFLRYLLLGNKSVDDAVSADIWKHADDLNFAMLSEELAYKHVADLLRDDKTVEKISLYGRIRQLQETQIIIAVDFENTVINNIAVKKAQLLKTIKCDEKIIYKKRLVISFDDIVRIESGKEIIYDKQA